MIYAVELQLYSGRFYIDFYSPVNDDFDVLNHAINIINQEIDCLSSETLFSSDDQITGFSFSLHSGNIVIELDNPISDKYTALKSAISILKTELESAYLSETYFI